MRLLLLSEQLTEPEIYRTPWQELRPYSDLRGTDEELSHGLKELAVKGTLSERLRHRFESFDYVIGHAELFRWLCLLRIAGVRTPFAIVPDFNHVEANELYTLFLASQLRIDTDVVFAGCRAAARSFGSFGFKTEPFNPLGIPVDCFATSSGWAAAERKNERRLRPISLLFTGRLEPDKNILELIRAFRKIQRRMSCTLTIAYHIWDERYRRRCLREARRNRCIQFVRRPSLPILASLYQSADLFVSMATSKFETFGRSVVEAMSCGAVPVAPAYDGFVDSVAANAGFLVRVTGPYHDRQCDERAFITAVCRLANHPARLRWYRKNAIVRGRNYDSSISMRKAAEALGTISKSSRSDLRNPQMHVSFEGYPDAVLACVEALQGRAIGAAVDDYIRTGRVQPQFGNSARTRLLQEWFRHF